MAAREHLGTAGPVETDCGLRTPGRRADDRLAGVHRLDRGNELPGWQCLGEVGARPFPDRVADQIRLEVPGVEGNPTSVRMFGEHVQFGLVRLRLRERVVEDHVHVVADRLVGIELHDDDPLGVAIEHVGQAHQDDVVVVDQRNGDWASRQAGSHSGAEDKYPYGCSQPSEGGTCLNSSRTNRFA